MSDIVEQLRNLYAVRGEPIMREAAVEIEKLRETVRLQANERERLRAALQKIAYPEWGEYPSDEMIVSGKNRPRCAEGTAMSEKEGTLRMMASGRWAVCRAGRESVEITSGERFRVEFQSELKLTRMEFRHSPRRGYYTVDGYPLRDGLRAALGEEG
jgi:hypothetical protein